MKKNGFKLFGAAILCCIVILLSFVPQVRVTERPNLIHFSIQTSAEDWQRRMDVAVERWVYQHPELLVISKEITQEQTDPPTYVVVLKVK